MESTTGLLEAIEKIGTSREEFQKFEQEHPIRFSFQSLEKYINAYLAEHPSLTPAKIYALSNMSRSYGDQILNGRRKHPGKYKLIALCLAMGMERKEINRALRLAGQAELDPRSRLDRALIICANESIRSVTEINELLATYQIDFII